MSDFAKRRLQALEACRKVINGIEGAIAPVDYLSTFAIAPMSEKDWVIKRDHGIS